MRPYEAIIVFNTDLGERNIDASVSRYEKKIKDAGGAEITVAKWGTKKLPFTIKKNRKARDGAYIFIKFNGEGKTPNELKALLNVDEDVIRYSVIQSRPETEKVEQKVEIEPSMIANLGETLPQHGQS